MYGLPVHAEQPQPVESGTLVRKTAPRLVRDGFGPLACFLIGWKLVGLTFGICVAAAFGLSIYVLERRAGRPAALVRVSLVLVAIRAVVGLSAGSARVYLGQEIGIDVLLASAVLGSLAAGRPLTGWIADDVYPFTPEMRSSDTYRQVMRTVTLVWGCYFLARASVRLIALLTLSTDQYALVIALSDAPFLVVLLAWSVQFTLGRFRRDEQWAALIR